MYHGREKIKHNKLDKYFIELHNFNRSAEYELFIFPKIDWNQIILVKG